MESVRYRWIGQMILCGTELSEFQERSPELIKEIRARLGFLKNVGLVT